MKHSILISMLLLATMYAYAQKPNWKELTSFHAIMSATFHPAEEHNLKPLKDSSNVLLQRAKEWKESSIPKGFEAKAIKPLLNKLFAEAELLHAKVLKQHPEEELVRQITNLHTTFHLIVKECYEH